MNIKTETVIIDNMGSSHWSDSKKSDKHSSDGHRPEYMCVYILYTVISFREECANLHSLLAATQKQPPVIQLEHSCITSADNWPYLLIES